MNHAGIRSALSRIAWAYLLIHLHFRLNNLDVLPDCCLLYTSDAADDA